MRFIIFSLLLSITLTVNAGSALEQLNAFHKNVMSLKGGFTQTLRDAQSNKIQESSGTVWIKRPGLFRWEYTKPYPQVIVADGKHIWIYDPELEQVTVRQEAKAMGQAPSLILSGREPLEKNFKVTEVNRSDGYDWVSLIPHNQDTDFSAISVAFKSGQLMILELKDKLGQHTQIRFTELTINQSIESSYFKFKIPPGTEVVGTDKL